MDTIQQLYKKGLEYYDKGNLTQAIICFRQAAEQGNIDAQLKLSYCYWNGKGVEWNVREALKWQKAAAQQGNPEDMYFYGEMCLSGEAIDEFGADITDEGIEWLGKAVAKGSKQAVNRLSDIIPSDTEKAAIDKEGWKIHTKVSYDEDDIRRMAIESAQVRDMAAAQGNADAKKAIARLKPAAPAPNPTVAFKPNTETLKSTVAPKPTTASKQVIPDLPTKRVKEDIQIDILVSRIKNAIAQAVKDTYEKDDKIHFVAARHVLGVAVKNSYGEVTHISGSTICFKVMGYEYLGKISHENYNYYLSYAKRSDVYTYGASAYQLNKNSEIISSYSKDEAEAADKRATANSGWNNFKKLAMAVAESEMAKYNIKGKYKGEYYPIESIKIELGHM